MDNSRPSDFSLEAFPFSSIQANTLSNSGGLDLQKAGITPGPCLEHATLHCLATLLHRSQYDRRGKTVLS